MQSLQKSGSLKVGRIFGIDLKLHFSLIFLLLYVTAVSAIQFPFVAEQAGIARENLTVGPWLSGLIFSIGLLVSIVIHEYSHVAVAKMQGIRVRGVTLMMLGGVSEMGSVSEKPYAELKLAIVGPLASLALWIILRAIGRATSQPDIELFSYWLGNANLVLALFNLLPAFPLDGGRALRSLLVAKQGNLLGTENAVKVSRVLAWAMGIFGLLQFNFILMFIAWFIFYAAQAEWGLIVSRGYLKGVRVRDVMRKVDAIEGSTHLREAAARMLQSRSAVLPVKTQEGEVGLIQLEVLRTVSRELWSTTLVSELCSMAPKILNIDHLVSESLNEIYANPLHALPVEEDGKIVGVLDQSDVADVVKFKGLEAA